MSGIHCCATLGMCMMPVRPVDINWLPISICIYSSVMFLLDLSLTSHLLWPALAVYSFCLVGANFRCLGLPVL